jgi:hypothetical protein
MIDLSSFSNMFPSLASMFDRETLNALSPSSPATQNTEPEDAQESDQDSLELSGPARLPIPSGISGASFDTPTETPPIAVAENGTYAPTTQTSHRMGMSMGFEFNLSIERQVTSSVAHAPREIDQPASGSAARLSALESRSLYYQSVMNESRGLLAGGYTESRSVQTELFYSRTRELSLNLPAGRSEQFDQTRAQVSRSFELNISMDFSFLGQFTSQSQSISSLDDDLFGQYLDNTGGLADRSSDALQSFFDDVDRILQDSEAFVKESLGSFFSQVRDQFGLSSEEAGMLEEMVMSEVTSFFGEVESFLSESRTMLEAPSQAAPEAIEAPAPEPETEPSDEEDPAAILA